MESINPVEWSSWLYGRVFQNHPYLGIGIVLLVCVILGLITWARIKNIHLEVNQGTGDEGRQRDWWIWLYGKLSQSRPILGAVAVVLMFVFFGLLIAVRGADKFREAHPAGSDSSYPNLIQPGDTTSSLRAQQSGNVKPFPNKEQLSPIPKRKIRPTKLSAQTSIEERRLIVSQLVEQYEKENDGKGPTLEWINRKLKDQNRDFLVTLPAQRPNTVTFDGGRFEGNRIGILNENPNTNFTFNGTEFINNEIGFANMTPPKTTNNKTPLEK